MSNDLVKRLRAAAKHPMMDNNCKADVFDVADAADRIEELEAKLAKAEVINGLLTVLAILNDPNDGRFPEAVDLAERFSTTLAELSSAMKGQDDE